MVLYYIKKIKLSIISRYYRYKFSLNAVAGICHGPIDPLFTFKHTVCLAFYPSHVHLGDQLFHLPMVHMLISQGISVHILGPTPLAFLFEAMGCQIRSNGQSSPGSVIVTKRDCLSEVIHEPGGYFLGLNYRRMPGPGRIGDLISNAVQSVLSPWVAVKKMEFPGIDSYLGMTEMPARSWPPGPIVVVNNCVNSNRVNARLKQRSFWTRVCQLKHNATVLFIGERSNTPLPAWVDQDYRGKLSFSELFRLCHTHASETTLVTFDTVIAHMGVLCGVSAVHVVCKSNKQLVSQRFVPFVSIANHPSTQCVQLY